MWYCVITVETNTVRYLGNSEDAAATLWNPGTVLGVGESRHEAVHEARQLAEGVV